MSRRLSLKLRSAQAEALAEKDLAHLIVVDDFLGRALKQDFPGVDYVGAVYDRKRLLHVMVRHQDADAAVLQVGDNALDLDDRNRIDTGERLVKANGGGGKER